MGTLPLKEGFILFGGLSTILDSGPTSILRVTQLEIDSLHSEITLQGVILSGEGLLSRETSCEGFVVPAKYTIYSTPLPTTLLRLEEPLSKILVAGTAYEKLSDHPFKFTYPVLRGCARMVPLTDEEKLICLVRGIPYE